MSHARRAATISAVFAGLLSMPDLFHVGASAPRFLMPTFALLAVPSAIGVPAVTRRSRLLGFPVTVLLMAAGIWSVVEAEQAVRRSEALVAGDAVKSLAAGRDCLVLARYGSPQVGVTSGFESQRLVPDEAGCQLLDIEDRPEVVIISYVGGTPAGVAAALTEEFIDGPPSWRSVVVDSDRTTCDLRSEAGE